MTALLLIDLQNDFMPGGSLAVPHGDAVVPVANAAMERYELVIASQDWHPAGHSSFASQHPGNNPGDLIDLDGLPQVLWPDHCVQHTPGAELHSGLNQQGVNHIIYKGTDPRVDSYSAFFDNVRKRATGLEAYLRERDVDAVHILGLATDYCVKFSALDAAELGFRTTVLREGCRGIDLKPGDIDAAWQFMRETGIAVM